MKNSPPVVDIEIDEHTMKQIGNIPRWVEEAVGRELDPYKYVASGLFHTTYDEVTIQQRRAVKSLVFYHLYTATGIAGVVKQLPPVCKTCGMLYCHDEYHKEAPGPRQRK